MARPFRLTAPVVPEHDLHVAVVAALTVLLPADAIFTSWDLANSKSAIEGARKKRRRCLPGWPDMGIYWNGRHVLLELKRAKGGVVSPEQKAVHGALAANGFPVRICHSVDEVLDAVSVAGIPLRGRVI